MNLISKILMLAPLLLITGCNETGNAPKTEKTQVFKTQIDALEKSKQVEQVLQDGAQQQRQETEKQTQ